MKQPLGLKAGILTAKQQKRKKEKRNGLHNSQSENSSTTVSGQNATQQPSATCVKFSEKVFDPNNTLRASLQAKTPVVSEGNKTAVSGKLASLSCHYGLPEKVQEVLWRKVLGRGEVRTVASYAKNGEPTIEELYKDRVSLGHSLSESQLSIRPLRTEDEGCYACEFWMHPDSIKSAIVCLTVYVLPRPQVSYKTTSPGVIEANCTSASRPPAEIVWNVEGDNRTMGPPVSISQQLDDGTTLVSSTLIVQAGLLKDVSIKCLVHHRGLESAIAVSMNTKIGTALTILISVTTVAFLLVMSLCICLWKCFLHKEE